MILIASDWMTKSLCEAVTAHKKNPAVAEEIFYIHKKKLPEH